MGSERWVGLELGWGLPGVKGMDRSTWPAPFRPAHPIGRGCTRMHTDAHGLETNLTEAVIGSAVEVSKVFGAGFLEKV